MDARGLVKVKTLEALFLDSGLDTDCTVDPPPTEQLAPAELLRATEALERAATTRDALDDVAMGNFLVHLACRRAAIGCEAARQRALDRDVEVAP